MLDFSKLRKGTEVSVNMLINELMKEDPDKIVCICGSSDLYFHVDEDGNVILDTEPLYEDYEEEFNKDEIPVICPIEFLPPI